VIHSLVSPGARLLPIRLQSCLFQYLARAISAFLRDPEPRYQSIQNIFAGHPLRGMAFRHRRSPPRAPTPQQLARLFHFRPISSEHITPLSRVISITMSPSRQPYHTRATSSSQAPWRPFPSDLTDVSLFDPFVHFYGPNLICLCCLGTLPLPLACPHLQSVHGLFLTFTD
jgi:hypothetical protein